ncbi:juvenile hormone acid O-methyltransferase [Lucilia sericata]|uniref:juvenile hormone acid O-methyltransferase n=1 Tax=Lucilia sericata TaxID=13632 RepID=UPI0018A8141F|nr:juvenile hormone acid O-methyltransferase [Lucilia sericata]
MNQACLYHRANQVQRHDAEQIIKEYANILQWRLDGTDALLDVGSGSGDVLMDFIYNIMPPKFERIVGSDISPKMVNYAKNCYYTHEKCDFRVLDIGTKNDIPNDMKEQFDHVTSFYCLHWIQNQRQALQNIYNLLKAEGGDCLLVFLASNPIFDVYKLLSKSTKWSTYMKDVDQFISPLHYSKDPKTEFSAMLKEVGFSIVNIELKHKVYVYEGLEILKDNVKAVCPFLERMPLNLHDTFMDDFINTVTSLDLKLDHHSNELDSKFNSPYKLLIAYARKSPQIARGSVIDMISSEKFEKGLN